MQREGLSESREISFEFRKQRYVYNEADHVFEKLKYPVKVRLKGRLRLTL